MNLSKLLEMVKDRGVWYAAVHGIIKSWTQLSVWTTYTYHAWASQRVGTQWVINLSLSLSLSVSLSASVCLSLLHTRAHTLQVLIQYNNKLWPFFFPILVIAAAITMIHWVRPLVFTQGLCTYFLITEDIKEYDSYCSFLNMWNITQPGVILKWSTFQLFVVNGDLKTFICS